MTERRRRARAVSIARVAAVALGRVLGGAFDFVRRVWDKAGQDDIFFLAGGIAFNILVAAIPFVLLLVAIFGFVLQRMVDDPARAAVDYVVSILPPSQQVVRLTRQLVEDVVSRHTRFGILGLVLFVWSSTRLIGTLRSVLREVFELEEERGIIQGKIFDLQMVIVAGTLFLANTAVTVVLEALHTSGVEYIRRWGWEPLPVAERAWAQFLAFSFIFLMFLLIYRYLPKRRIGWRTALVAATFTSVAWELLKGLFSWYVAHVASYTTTYGALATLIILVFWIYYSAVVFILGGEVGQVYDLIRTRRRQRELLE
jgi:membrane protein